MATPVAVGERHPFLASRQLERSPVDACLAMAEIEGEAAGVHDVGMQPRGPAQHGAQPRQQFLHRERL